MGGWQCPACKGGNPEGTRFCGWCGIERAAYESDPERPDERRLVTALFADISGFTTLSEQIDDPEALHEVIAPVISGMAAIAERYEGTIAKYAGDALLVFFGAPVAHEDDATRALLVALEMHAALPDLLATLPPEARGLELHIGVNTGRVISGQYGGDIRNDYSILGDSVILAQRLESVAPNGEVYVGESTYTLTRDAFLFESVGELELKGKQKPVAAWRLLGRRLVSAAPTRVGPVIGRAQELSAIDGMLIGLTRGRGGGVVSVSGEPGVGKSRLLLEAQQRAGEREVEWLQTRCLSYGAHLPYWPYAELVRTVAGIGPTASPSEARGLLERAGGIAAADAPYLARLVGAHTAPGELPTNAEDLQRGLHEAITNWLVNETARRPTVVAVEDVHWIDDASRALTAHLARVTHGWPLALVLTARPEGVPVLDGIASNVEADWRAHFDIQPLDHDAIVVLLTALLEGEPPHELVQVTEDRSCGNPLFIGELVRALLEQGAVISNNGRWRMRPGWAASDVPDTIERVLTSRIDLLPPEQATVLQTASVIGRLVRLPILRAVVDDDALDDHLDALVHVGLLDPSHDGTEPALLFHHALVQDVAYERLLRRHRRAIHCRVAETAEALYGTEDDVVELLARHSYLGERPEAVAYLERAADRARKLFANSDAIVHLERAAEVASAAGDEARRRSLLVALGDVRNLLGDYDAALHSYRDAGPLLAARSGEADVLRKMGDYDAVLDIVDRALAGAAADDPDTASLWYERGRTLMARSQYGDAIEALERGLLVARPDDAILGTLMVTLADAVDLDGRAVDALQFGLFARRTFERTGDLAGLAAALRVVGNAYVALERFDQAADVFRHGLALAERAGHVEEAGGLLLNLGWVEEQRGNTAAAAECDREAVARFERIDHAVGRAVGYGNLAHKLLRLGEPRQALEFADRALAIAQEIGHAGTLADAGEARAEAVRLLDAGEAATA
jgi:adenylate cyclase